MSPDEQPDEAEVRRPPAPPDETNAPDEESLEGGEKSASSADEPGRNPETPATLGNNEWLDPNSERHRRRHHTQLSRRRDRLRRRWRKWRRKRRKIADTAHWYRPRNVSLAVVLVVFIGVASVLLSTYFKINNIRRAPMIPVAQSTPSLGTNIVLLSSNGQPGSLVLDSKTLVVQFIHLSANNQTGQVIDLPNNLVIGSGTSAQTIGTIYTRSGTTALVGAIQTSMGLTVNHVIQTSFSGYRTVTDDLGGLTLQTDSGMQNMTGEQAEAYVDQSTAPEIGRRFQHWSKAMLKGTLQPGVLLNPFTVWSIFSDTVSNIVVDETLDNGAFIGLLWRMTSLDPSNLHFFTAPNSGFGTLRGQPVLLADPIGFARLSTAIRSDDLATIGLFQ